MRVLLAFAMVLPLLAGCTGGGAGPVTGVHFIVHADDVDGDGEEDLQYLVMGHDKDSQGTRLDGTMVVELRRPLGHSSCLEGEAPSELVATKHIVLRAGDGVERKSTGVAGNGDRRTVTVIEYVGLLAGGDELDLDGAYDIKADFHLAGGIRFERSDFGHVDDGDIDASRRPLDATTAVTRLRVDEAKAEYGNREIEVTGGTEYYGNCAFSGRFQATLWPEDAEEGAAAAATVDVPVAWSDFSIDFQSSITIALPGSLPAGFYRYEATVDLADGRRIADEGSLLFY